MSMERSRRDRFANIAPTADEIKVAALLAGLACLLITPLVVQGIVAWITSGDFAWPNGHLLDAYGGLLQGHYVGGMRRGATNA